METKRHHYPVSLQPYRHFYSSVTSVSLRKVPLIMAILQLGSFYQLTVITVTAPFSGAVGDYNVIGIMWKRIITAGALLLIALASVCVCFPQPAGIAHAHCHGMPAKHQQNHTPSTCCTAAPAPESLVTVGAQYERLLMLAGGIVAIFDLDIVEQIESTPATSLLQSLPHCSSILRI